MMGRCTARVTRNGRGRRRRRWRSTGGRAGAAGLELKMAFEVEWFVGRDEGDGTTPACAGPAYGMTRLVELSDYIRELLVVLEDQGVIVDQFHPEYAAGQLELSVAAAHPV